MLENIKSTYTIKMIFAQVHNRIILDLIKYNKKLQKIYDININNYKMFNGISIIFESEGKGKEYDNYKNMVIFEGEYKNGKRNGKGKEYSIDYCDQVKLLFEGEYLNNKRNGKGKEYFSEGNVKFEGEYLNGRKWNGKGYNKYNIQMFEIKNGNGHVKENIDFSSELIFEGEYLNGEKNGKGKIYSIGLYGRVLKFEGEYLNGQKNGKGIEYYYGSKIKKFEGEYLNGKEWNGKGYNQNKEIIYELKNGKGIVQKYIIPYTPNYDDELEYELILLFECEYSKGEKNGKGKEYDSEGNLIFEGEYLNDKKEGKGKEYDSIGYLIFEGEYLYDHKKSGKEFHNGNLIYEGEYLFNKKLNGKIYDIKGNTYEIINGNGKVKEYDRQYPELITFDGEFINFKKKGICKEYYTTFDGKHHLIFEGEFYDEQKNGKGKEYNEKGELLFEGEYKNGLRWKGKMQYYNSKGEIVFVGDYIDGNLCNDKRLKKEYFNFLYH